MRRIAERHEDIAPVGVEDEGSRPCAAANDHSVRPESADFASRPLHSLPDARAGESGKSASSIEEHDKHGNYIKTTLINELLISIVRGHIDAPEGR